MVAWFTPVTGLDQIIAEKIAQPFLRDVLDNLRDEARKRAPDTRVWVTMRDERVRTTHRDTDAQVIPANLRFKMPKADGSGHDLARHPRDPALPIEQRANCRCDDPTIPQLLRETIHASDVHVENSRVSGSVETTFPRAAESEFGTSEDQAAAFMRGALQEVALRLQNGRAR